MKIAVFGSGGVGGYFGGRLAAAGEDVAFIARGAHLLALQQGGLAIESPLATFAFRSSRPPVGRRRSAPSMWCSSRSSSTTSMRRRHRSAR
jgi:ketopantoate reductase